MRHPRPTYSCSWIFERAEVPRLVAGLQDADGAPASPKGAHVDYQLISTGRSGSQRSSAAAGCITSRSEAGVEI